MIKYTNEYWADVEEVVSVIPQLSRLNGKSIFITGATGMICSSVAEILFWLNKSKNNQIKILLGGA